jgi:hypothetical protein
MSDVPKQPSGRYWFSTRVSVWMLMGLVLVLGCAFGWLGRLKQAEAAYRDASEARQLAQLAVGKIAGLERAEGRMAWFTRSDENGYLSGALHLTDLASLQQATIAFKDAKTNQAEPTTLARGNTNSELQSAVETATADELALKAAYDRLKSGAFLLYW